MCVHRVWWLLKHACCFFLLAVHSSPSLSYTSYVFCTHNGRLYSTIFSTVSSCFSPRKKNPSLHVCFALSNKYRIRLCSSFIFIVVVFFGQLGMARSYFVCLILSYHYYFYFAAAASSSTTSKKAWGAREKGNNARDHKNLFYVQSLLFFLHTPTVKAWLRPAGEDHKKWESKKKSPHSPEMRREKKDGKKIKIVMMIRLVLLFLAEEIVIFIFF